ncbi:hypothetical protein [uncultured Desulfovibrio sp.]|uniref:hypothetical protein n=1 Tax=uncultured Desulfovibrio sp. TaxID=167968 RepID=UPI00261588E0|nr:hypothetical protein [uncultured Desulfovibrio sp.]
MRNALMYSDISEAERDEEFFDRGAMSFSLCPMKFFCNITPAIMAVNRGVKVWKMAGFEDGRPEKAQDSFRGFRLILKGIWGKISCSLLQLLAI